MKATSSRRLTTFFAGAVFLLGGCVSQQQMDSMQVQLRRQEQQIQQFNAQLSGVQPAQADTWAQVQSLRQEMGAVRGQIDDFNNATADMGGLSGLALQVRQNRAALQAIETQFAMDLNLDQPPAAMQPGALPGAAAGGLIGAGTSTPGVGAGGALPGTVTLPPANSSAPVTARQPGSSPPAAVEPHKDTATALYDAGIQAFNARRYQDGLKSFKDFTATYPKNKLISNAWFWSGECNFALGNFAAAALDYEEVISKYPSSGKIASAYLKQGMSFIKTQKKDAAKFRLNELIKKFPKSPEAARAKQVLKDLK